MKIDLTIKEYAHLRAIYELEGDCDKGNLDCADCPMQLGKLWEGPSYPQYKCVDSKIRTKIAKSILKADEDVMALIVEEKI